MVLSEYEAARRLLVNLQFLKNLAKKAVIFLDYSAATKGLFSKTYKFKIYYKYDGDNLFVVVNFQFCFSKI